MTRTTVKVAPAASRVLRKSAIVASLCAAMLVAGMLHPTYAYGDTLSDLDTAQGELVAAKENLTEVQNNLNTPAAVTKDVVISGKTPLYVPVSGNTAKPANSTLVAVEGKYVDGTSDSTPRTQAQILNYINSVRQDAKNSGLVDRYVAVAWSKNLERTAQVRAAEISIYGDHTRPSGESWYGVSDEGLMATSAENLSWGANYYNNIKMWVDEKECYKKYLSTGKNPGCVYGHYRNLVNPSYNKIGLAQFNSDRSTINPYNTAMAAEFSAAATNSQSSDVKAVNKTVYQGVYVKTAAMGSVGTAGATTFNPTKVSGDPVWTRSAQVKEAKKLAQSLGYNSATTADLTAAQNRVTTAQKNVEVAMDNLAKANKSALPDGVYKISMAISSGSVLDVAKGSATAANVSIWSDTGNTWQKWKVTHDSQGYVTITSLISGLPLESAGKSPANGSNVEQYPSNGGLNQKWVAIKDGSSYRLINAASINGTTYALDVPKANTAPGTNVQVWTKNTSDAQKWNFAKTDLITPGMYRINSQITANDTVALDIPSGAVNSGANVHVWAANESIAQRFYIGAPDSNGAVRIQAIASGLYVTADADGNVTQRTENASASQRWKVEWQTDGTFTFTNSGTNKRLALASASSANGTNVAVAAKSTAATQKWRVTSRATLPTGLYTIFSSANPELGIDISNGSKSAGANALIWKLKDAQWQKWKLVANSDGTYSFVSANSNNALDVDHGYMKNGANVLQWTNSGAANQRFYVTWDPTLGGFKIAAKANKNYVFDMAGGATNGANLCLWQDKNGKNQRFGFKLTH